MQAREIAVGRCWKRLFQSRCELTASHQTQSRARPQDRGSCWRAQRDAGHWVWSQVLTTGIEVAAAATPDTEAPYALKAAVPCLAAGRGPSRRYEAAAAGSGISPS